MASPAARMPDGITLVATTSSRAQKFWLQVGMFFAIVAPFCLTVYAAILLSFGEIHWGYPLATAIVFFFGGLGITAGYHRMLTHQAFQAHPAVQYFLLIFGAIGGMGSPIIWTHKHLHHHSESDREDDIHSPHTGRFHGWFMQGFLQWFDAHMGWMFRDQPIRVSMKARQVTDTPAARFVHKTWALWMVAGLLLPLCFGWKAFIWVGMVRFFMNHHVTWSVNSICHLWGKQPFKNTKDHSKNNALVGILALGEGWHNNHHFRPNSARHGLLPGQIDLTYMVICLLERCKLVSNVQRYVQCPDCKDWHSAASRGERQCSKCRKVA